MRNNLPHQIDRSFFQRLQHSIIFLASIAGLVLSWYYVFQWIAFLTELFLVPWDLESNRPPLGSVERSVNDFFERIPGALLPSSIVIAISLGLLLFRIAKKDDPIRVFVEYTVVNILFIAALILFPIFVIMFKEVYNVLRQLMPLPTFNNAFDGLGIAIILTMLLMVFLIQFLGWGKFMQKLRY